MKPNKIPPAINPNLGDTIRVDLIESKGGVTAAVQSADGGGLYIGFDHVGALKLASGAIRTLVRERSARTRRRGAR
jgi:hypothetical protein